MNDRNYSVKLTCNQFFSRSSFYELYLLFRLQEIRRGHVNSSNFSLTILIITVCIRAEASTSFTILVKLNWRTTKFSFWIELSTYPIFVVFENFWWNLKFLWSFQIVVHFWNVLGILEIANVLWKCQEHSRMWVDFERRRSV